jgi:putative copper resistance protein D
MASALARLQSPRSFGLFFVLGLVLAALLTVPLATGEEGRALGPLFFCTIASVPEPQFPRVLLTVAVEPIPTFLVAAAGAGYVLLWSRVRAMGKLSVATPLRLWLFLAGIALVVLTLFGPIAAYARTFLTAHMIQHFILITIAPPLLIAGAPLTILLVAAGGRRRNRVFYPFLHSRLFHAVTHPLLGLILFAGVPLSWYLTPAFELSLTNTWMHYLAYVLFLFAGIHYWWPVVAVNPTRWNLPHPVRVGYLFALVPIHAFLGTLFYGPNRVLFEDLAAINRAWGPSPLLDQQIAGAFVLLFGEILGLVAMLVAGVAWMRADEREARRFDHSLRRRTERAEAGRQP